MRVATWLKNSSKSATDGSSVRTQNKKSIGVSQILLPEIFSIVRMDKNEENRYVLPLLSQFQSCGLQKNGVGRCP